MTTPSKNTNTQHKSTLLQTSNATKTLKQQALPQTSSNISIQNKKTLPQTNTQKPHKLSSESIRYVQRSIHDYIWQAMQLDKQKNKLLEQAEYLSSKLYKHI